MIVNEKLFSLFDRVGGLARLLLSASETLFRVTINIDIILGLASSKLSLI